MKKSVVLGVGAERGLGARLASRFAENGMYVYLAGRTKEKLEIVSENIKVRGGQSAAVVCDATDENQVIELFDSAGDDIDLAIYNVGNNTPGRICDMEATYFENSWRVGCYGGFLFSREAVRRMLPNKRGTILFTGASASWRGRENYGAFNSAKGALRNLAQAMAKEYAVEGIHVGHIVVDGIIDGDRVRQRRPELFESLNHDQLLDIDFIVDGFEYLYSQSARAWSFELDIRPSLEKW